MTPGPILDSPVGFAELVLGTRVHALQAEFLQCRSPIRIVIGGRRAGKSTALALLIVWLVVRHVVNGRPFRALITAPTLDQARVLLAYVLKLFTGSAVGPLVIRHTESPFPTVTFPGGVEIMVRSLAEHAKHIRGHGDFDLLVLDEAGFVQESVIDQVLKPLLADRGGSLVLSSTPTVRGGSLERWFLSGRDGTDPRVRSFHFPSTANPFLDQAYVETMRRELPREIWEVEWEGQWSNADGSVFRWDDVTAACGGNQPSPSQEGALPRYVAGFDPARLRDASALVVMDVTALPRRVVHLEDLSGLDYPSQAERVAAVARQFRGCKVVADATGPGVAVVELLRAGGVFVEPITFSAQRKQELVAGLCVVLEKHELVFPPDRRLLDELRWFRATRTSAGSVKYEAAPGAKDDFIMAMCLAIAGSGGGARPESFASAGLMPFLRSNDRVSFGDDTAQMSLPSPEFSEDSWLDAHGRRW